VNAFFLTCFHLKDWVKQSGHPKAPKVEEFIASHPEMELCRKLCHASKHFELDSGSAIATSVPGKSWVVVDDDGSTWEVLTLASRCMVLWERFPFANRRPLGALRLSRCASIVTDTRAIIDSIGEPAKLALRALMLGAILCWWSKHWNAVAASTSTVPIAVCFRSS
jgi:hypothetical protein